MNIPIFNLTLRSLSADDGPEFYALVDRNRLRLRNYFPLTIAVITSLDACFKYIDEKLQQTEKREHFAYVIEDAHQHLQGLLFIKNIDWRVPRGELAYFIDQFHQGQGIMTKALAQVVAYGFDNLGMNKLFLLTAVDNHPSRRIAEKNSFKLEGIIRSNFKLTTGDLIDMAYYGIVPSDIA